MFKLIVKGSAVDTNKQIAARGFTKVGRCVHVGLAGDLTRVYVEGPLEAVTKWFSDDMNPRQVSPRGALLQFVEVRELPGWNPAKSIPVDCQG